MPAFSFREPLNVTPADQSDPVGVSRMAVSAMRSLTDVGASPVVSTNWTLNVNVVEVVPAPGVAVPLPIVTVPHVRASTGRTPTPSADRAIRPARAIQPAGRRLDRPRGAMPHRRSAWATGAG